MPVVNIFNQMAIDRWKRRFFSDEITYEEMMRGVKPYFANEAELMREAFQPTKHDESGFPL